MAELGLGYGIAETSVTTGTASYVLQGALTRSGITYRSFQGQVASGTTVEYAAFDGANLEIVRGVYTESGGTRTLSRATIIFSTNSNNAISWSAGTRTIELIIAGPIRKNAAGNRVVMPDTAGTMREYGLPTQADTLVGLAATQTLTNKTLANPAFTGDAKLDGYSLRRSRGEPYPGNPTDFNDMTTPGFYNTTGSGWSNGPMGSSAHTGSLEVLGRSSGSGLVQIWRNHNTGATYVRAYNSPSWGSWSCVAGGYETGTFTPSYGGSSSNPTITHDIQLGKYTKIGDQVGFTLTLGTDSVSGGAGNLRVLGLPFSAHSTYGVSGHVGSAFSFSTVPVVWYLDTGQNYIELRTTSNSSALASVSDLATGANSNRLGISGIYFTS